MKTVDRIGGEGFIGSHVTKVFLNQGYQVRVSINDISREHNYKQLMTFNPSDNLNISELDIMDKDTLKGFQTITMLLFIAEHLLYWIYKTVKNNYLIQFLKG